MRPTPLPAALGDLFTTTTARSAGVPASRLRAADLERPYRGVRVISRHPTPDDDGNASPEGLLLERARRYAARMTRHEFFSHVTAAVIWGLPLPFALVCDRLVDVCVLSPHRNPEGRRIVSHCVQPAMARVVEHPTLGYRLTSPATTWAMLGAVLIDPYDVVAAADAVVREPLHHSDPPALATVEHLHNALSAGRRRRATLLREALPRVSTRSRSRQETRLRLTLVDGGAPMPEVNFDVVELGVWIAQVDLAYPRQRLAVEYEGDHHRTAADQWATDIDRVERLHAAGWRVIRVTRADLIDRGCRTRRRAFGRGCGRVLLPSTAAKWQSQALASA